MVWSRGSRKLPDVHSSLQRMLKLSGLIIKIQVSLNFRRSLGLCGCHEPRRYGMACNTIKLHQIPTSISSTNVVICSSALSPGLRVELGGSRSGRCRGFRLNWVSKTALKDEVELVV